MVSVSIYNLWRNAKTAKVWRSLRNGTHETSEKNSQRLEGWNEVLGKKEGRKSGRKAILKQTRVKHCSRNHYRVLGSAP